MYNSLLLRKGVVMEIISKEEFLLEDVIDREIISMTIPEKFRLNYFKVEIGDFFYVTVSPFDKKRGRIILLSSFKMNQDLNIQKVRLDTEHSNLETNRKQVDS